MCPCIYKISKYCRQERALLVNESKIEEWNRYNAIASQAYDKYK